MERPEEGYYLGALAVNLVAAELILAAAAVTVILATWPEVPWTGLLVGGAILMILVPAIGYPFSKLIWLAVDLRFQRDDAPVRFPPRSSPSAPQLPGAGTPREPR